MKKILFFILLFFISINVSAKTITVKYKSCSDGDTAHFTYNGEDIRARFIGINSPELEHENQAYEYFANEAKEYTCNRLQKANIIQLEYDDKAGEKDKYDRHLVYVWVDNKLLNVELVYYGYAEAKYIYDNYKYKNELIKAEEHAKVNKLGIWKDYSNIPSNDIKEQNSNIEEEDIIDHKLFTLVANVAIVIAVAVIFILSLIKK